VTAKVASGTSVERLEITFVQGRDFTRAPVTFTSMWDRMLERSRKATRSKPYTAVQYARFAGDLMILMNGAAVTKRREEIGKLKVEYKRRQPNRAPKEGRKLWFPGLRFSPRS